MKIFAVSSYSTRIPCRSVSPTSRLKKDLTLVIVTHNMQQAARVADMTAFFNLEVSDGGRSGVLVEYDRTATIFTHPSDKRTEDYVTGRFG